jgi:AcrR family transcriptional regulator
MDEWSGRQAQILEAALNVFSKKGFDGARTKEIASEAGISEALVFKHFKSKESILDALSGLVIRKIVAPMVLDSVRQVIKSKREAPMEELFGAVLADRLELVRRNQKLMKTFLLEAVRRPSMLKTIKKELLPEIIEVFELAIRPLIDRGDLPSGLDVSMAARTAIGLVAGYVIGSEVAPELFGKRDDEREIPILVSHFLRGIGGAGEKGVAHE